MGLNSPRYSRGASGFMSHMSMCDEPPQRKNRIVDFAGCLRGAAIDVPNAERPKLNPASPIDDAAMNARRLMLGENSGTFIVRKFVELCRKVNQLPRFAFIQQG